MNFLNIIIQSCPHSDKEEQLLWLLHRITGIGMFIFLSLHVLHIGLMSFGPEPFNWLITLFRQPPAQLLHVFLFFSVLFHAINGARTILLDFWPALRRYNKPIASAAAIIFLLTFIPGALLILMDAFLP